MPWAVGPLWGLSRGEAGWSLWFVSLRVGTDVAWKVAPEATHAFPQGDQGQAWAPTVQSRHPPAWGAAIFAMRLRAGSRNTGLCEKTKREALRSQREGHAVTREVPGAQASQALPRLWVFLLLVLVVAHSCHLSAPVLYPQTIEDGHP